MFTDLFFLSVALSEVPGHRAAGRSGGSEAPREAFLGLCDTQSSSDASGRVKFSEAASEQLES